MCSAVLNDSDVSLHRDGLPTAWEKDDPHGGADSLSHHCLLLLIGLLAVPVATRRAERDDR